MHKLVKDIRGRQFGQLTAIQYIASSKWLCRCACGNEAIVKTCNLNNGHTQSCGCLRTQATVERTMTHGLTGSKVYRAWEHIKTRCYNPNYHATDKYQGRGIEVCERWLNSFEAFYSDMGDPPTPKHMLERIDNDGSYSPDNCRWATRKEQMRNRSNTVRLTYGGTTKPLIEWAEQFGLPVTTLRARIRRNWSIERALTTPVKTHTKS